MTRTATTGTRSAPNHRDHPELLFVHGAWQRSWCWDDLVPILANAGWRTSTIDLPSALDHAAPQPVPAPGLYDDAAAITRELSKIVNPVVVVAHSYGGAPVTEAIGQADNVVHVVYIAAFQLDVGESVRLSLGVVDPALPIPTSGYSPPPARADFYSDVPDDIAARATARMCLQSDPSRSQLITRAGWRTVPSTYIVCEDDMVIAPARQEQFAVRASATRHLAAGHSPFYSQPYALAEILIQIASALPGSRHHG